MLSLVGKFIAVFKLQHRQAWYHKYAALGTIASWGFRLGITVLLYAGIYGLIHKTSVKGVTLPIAISSMVLYAVYSCLGGREMFRAINEEYLSGVMEIWLNKPLPYLGLKMAEGLGRSIPAAVGMLLVGLALFFYSNLANETDHLALRIVCGIPLMIGGVIIAYIIYAIVGLSAIWLADARGVNMVHDKFIMIFGGIYVPISFFPGWFRAIGESLPAGATMFVGQVFYPDFLHNTPRFFALQIFWIVVLSWSLLKLSRTADKHLTVNGG